jgi:hypothetical protein
MEEEFEPQYCHVKPFYLVRYFKKIALEMGENGDGKFDRKLLRK